MDDDGVNLQEDYEFEYLGRRDHIGSIVPDQKEGGQKHVEYFRNQIKKAITKLVRLMGPVPKNEDLAREIEEKTQSVEKWCEDLVRDIGMALTGKEWSPISSRSDGSPHEDIVEEWPEARMTELVIPGMINHHGNLFGGEALEMMDKTAAIVALRHANTNVVTAGMDSVSFLSAINESDVVEVIARLKNVGTSSMDIEVEVWGEDPHSQAREKCTEATLTMVALDEDGNPVEVPPLLASLSNAEKRRILEREVDNAKQWRVLHAQMFPDDEEDVSVPDRFVENE